MAYNSYSILEEGISQYLAALLNGSDDINCEVLQSSNKYVMSSKQTNLDNLFKQLHAQ